MRKLSKKIEIGVKEGTRQREWHIQRWKKENQKEYTG